ncbi:MAG: HAMP domain-containing histidine kinase [Clostridiales Family XIII bacterium]|nr:HAMP domain-containing histidine kinase [Clostridiales Family XIII bacterium]
MKFNKKSLSIKLWFYFTVFAVAILILIWSLQTVFLSSFYHGMKEKSVAAAADEIRKEYGQSDFTQTIDRLAYANSLLVYVTDQNGTLLYTSDEHGPGGEFGNIDKGPGKGGGNKRGLPMDYNDFLNKLSESKEASISYTVTQPNFSAQSFIYGRQFEDVVLYISTPIEPLDATIQILRSQLIYITIITVIAGFVVAFFISRKLARPITKITKSATTLATGDYEVRFEKGDYAEIDALSETLNFTATELSKVEALRRELIANISHDLRTPLTMIKGYTEMIEEVSGDDPESRARHLSIIRAETTRLEGLVGDILDLSVLQSGNESIHTENINLSEIVRNVLSRFETLAEQDGYHFISEIPHDQYVLADKSRMEQVLYNLIGNAVNYAGEDKTVRVRLIDLGGFVRFEVRDNGLGIEGDDIPHIWDRYYKAKEHSRSKISTGIGLAIVKNVLKLHDAKFGVESVVGEGSTFWFELKK